MNEHVCNCPDQNHGSCFPPKGNGKLEILMSDAPTRQELQAEVDRLTEQLIDARIAHINTVMALRNYQAYPPDERHICAGMTPEAFAAYLADPREFVRQQIKDGK